MQQYVLAEDLPAPACGIGRAAAGVVGHGLFRFVGQQQQAAVRSVGFYDFEFHALRI